MEFLPAPETARGEKRAPLARVQVLGTKEKENYIVEGFPVFWKEFSQDSTMINIPVKIKPVGSSMKWVKPV